MIDFIEVCRRATQGKLVSEKAFDQELFFPKIMALEKKYGIRPDLENPVNTSDDTADAIFHAAVDLLAEVGIYCQDTERIIEISRDEVLEAVREAPGPCWFGEDLDRRLYPVRRPDATDIPAWCHIGGGLQCSSEEIAFKTVESIGALPKVDSIAKPIVTKVRGITPAAGSPLGQQACVRSIEIARSALRQTGRPGAPILNGIPGAGTAVETIAASCPGLGLRPSDGWIVGFLSELKISYEAMNKCAFLMNIGGRIGSQGAPILGGYCGGPAGTAITNTAYIIAGILAMKGRYHLSFPMDINLGVSTTRAVLWAVGASSQAVSRNISYPFHMLGYCAGGPMTESYFYESAAYLLTAIPSGASAQSCLPAKATVEDHHTPMEFQFCAEVIGSAHKLTRLQANEIVKNWLPRYEDKLATASAGKSFPELYDLHTVQPNDEYVEFYKGIKEKLLDLGVPFRGRLKS
ncbi:MAG: monomethylamine:corrinoid methyltransferase [Proteobacteria bacterium]|nr:monomethylamine:corrinoid methyltransferase [Pseudomonadota bacterium]